jgi:hypothetical protein
MATVDKDIGPPEPTPSSPAPMSIWSDSAWSWPVARSPPGLEHDGKYAIVLERRRDRSVCRHGRTARVLSAKGPRKT